MGRNYMKYRITLFSVCLFVLNSMAVAYDAPTSKKNDPTCEHPQYVFSWNLSDVCMPAPRGGTTEGVPVTLLETPSKAWQALQETDIKAFERDRRAILAMAGGYRASFEFLETIGYTPDFQPAAPYQSWGTEYIYVVEDRGDFISLQHIMVMFFQEGEEVRGPMVMKHWRQDWQYQDRQLLEYAGNDTWQTRRLGRKDVNGTWSQSVFQVDDSPRYESYGKWQHNESFSRWESATTWRPLPRREHSVRDDYQVLEGINRHIILPTGWVQEEENFKLKLNKKGQPAGYVAKELGNNRYQRVVDFDFSAGDAYWQKTGPYWELVREHWGTLLTKKPRFELAKTVDGSRLFMTLFGQAESFAEGKLSDKQASQKIKEVLEAYWTGMQ